jgi:hypothetical protein
MEKVPEINFIEKQKLRLVNVDNFHKDMKNYLNQECSIEEVPFLINDGIYEISFSDGFTYKLNRESLINNFVLISE